MISIKFNGEKVSFKKGQFADLDSWYNEKYNELDNMLKTKVITEEKYEELSKELERVTDIIDRNI